MVRYDVAIIGGGCVGCSIALHLTKQSDLDICILEKEHHLAHHQSGRNSGVLHPGFNYEPGSLKAQFAPEGTRRLKEFAHQHGIPIEEFGVVVVATTDAEEARLDELDSQASENGVETDIIGPERLAELEPHAQGQAALHCPSAASIESQQYVYTLAREATAAGVDLLTGHEVQTIDHRDGTQTIDTTSGGFTADYLVNAAGLYADDIASELDVGTQYRIIPFRGDYHELVPEKRSLCRTMIYPTPDPELPFLGVHFTRRVDDRVIIGPNAVLAFGREAYRPTDVNLRELAGILGYRGFWRLLAQPDMLRIAIDELLKSYRPNRFVSAAQELVPALRRRDVKRSYSGIRAQLVSRDGDLINDPVFLPGPDSLHVLNAISPGLTTSLPVGEHLADRVLENLSA